MIIVSKKLTIEKMQQIATKKNGRCLSKVYTGIFVHLEWMCENGHTWFSTPNHIKNNNSWCPKCAKNARLTIEDMRNIAKKNNGKCLSTKYVNAHTYLKWKCNKCNHIWNIPYNGIQNGSWCPKCNTPYRGVSENNCRNLFQKIFDKKFPTKKPIWLINNKNNRMHLDGYNKHLCLAFEYNGVQHYKYTSFFHKNKNNFIIQKNNDKLKKQLCKQNGVNLIEIPYTLKNHQIKRHIIKLCRLKKEDLLNNEFESKQIKIMEYC